MGEPEVDAIVAQAREAAARATNAAEVEQARVRFLGRQGELTQFLRSIGSIVPPPRRPAAGAAANEAKRELETKWKEDRVVRANKLTRGFFKESYIRRTRYKIFLTETGGLSEVSIKGKHQFKNPDAGIKALWKTFKPNSEDKEMERSLFFQILRRVEENKRKFLVPPDI